LARINGEIEERLSYIGPVAGGQRRWKYRGRARLLAAAALAAAACGSYSSSADQQLEKVLIYRPLGTWSGSGNGQTDSFAGDSGAYRVTWQTRRLDTAGRTGKFRLSINSAISGRVLSFFVEQQGDGSDVAYVTTEPRQLYFVVESADLDWSFAVDEQFTAMAPRGSVNHQSTFRPLLRRPESAATAGSMADSSALREMPNDFSITPGSLRR
jgi:hypothetical protein